MKLNHASLKELTTVSSGFSKFKFGWTQPVLIACNEQQRRISHDEPVLH
jgi:hypothetical protein